MNQPTHDTDMVFVFEATQEQRHQVLLQVNERARALVQRSMANAVGQPADADGVVPGPQRLRLVLGYDFEDKSTKQREFLHGVVFPQIAEQAVFPDGTRFAAPVWKEHYRARFLPDKWQTRRGLKFDAATGQWVPAKRATPHRVRISTEDLSVKQYSRHIDQVIDTAVAEFGVVFDFVEQDREEVRWSLGRKPARPVA